MLLHLGAVRFGVTGPLHYTLTARDAVALCDLARPRVVVPVHYEGWSHFSQGRADVEAASRARARRPLAPARRAGDTLTRGAR